MLDAKKKWPADFGSWSFGGHKNLKKLRVLSRKLHPSYAKWWFLKKDAFEQLLLPSKMDVLRGRGAKNINWPEICCKALSKFFFISLQQAFKWLQDGPR